VWRELLDHPPQWTGQVLAAGALTFVQMGLLGAVLTLADRPLFTPHLRKHLRVGAVRRSRISNWAARSCGFRQSDSSYGRPCGP